MPKIVIYLRYKLCLGRVECPFGNVGAIIGCFDKNQSYTPVAPLGLYTFWGYRLGEFATSRLNF